MAYVRHASLVFIQKWLNTTLYLIFQSENKYKASWCRIPMLDLAPLNINFENISFSFTVSPLDSKSSDYTEL